MTFRIDNNGLYLNFRSKTEKYNIEEIVAYNGVDKKIKEYLYQIGYCKKDKKITDKIGVTFREISGYSIDTNKLRIFEKMWINDKLRTSKNFDVDGTVEEMALKHEMGIDAFNYFRFLLNKLLPFRQDIIAKTISKDIIEKHHLEIFIPDFNDKETKQESIKKLVRK